MSAKTEPSGSQGESHPHLATEQHLNSYFHMKIAVFLGCVAYLEMVCLTLKGLQIETLVCVPPFACRPESFLNVTASVITALHLCRAVQFVHFKEV